MYILCAKKIPIILNEAYISIFIYKQAREGLLLYEKELKIVTDYKSRTEPIFMRRATLN